jgi:hypothetical protein
VRTTLAPKPGGGFRRLSSLDPADAAELAAVVGRMTGRIERSLGPSVYANRVSGPGDRLAPWRPARARWNAELTARIGARARPVVLVADVREFYGSVSFDALARSLTRAGITADEISCLGRLLAWFREDGVVGLPVGPDPSAVLANSMMAGVDQTLREAGVLHMRWVDDFVAFVPDPAHARRASSELRRALADVSLELNDEKTLTIEDPREARSILLKRGSPAGGGTVA